MNPSNRTNHLPTVTAVLAVAGMNLRRLLYVFATDAKGLLIPRHPLELALTSLSLLTLAWLALSVRKLGGSEAYGDNFAPSGRACFGHILAGLGIALTVALNPPKMPGNLGSAWVILGLLSPACLFAAGIARSRGKKPFFLLHLIPCLFLVVHIVNHYQTWSGNPQLQDDIYAIFGTMAAMFFLFHCANFDVGLGKRRMQLFLGLATAYLCCVNIWNSEYGFLYLGLACLGGSGICRVEPVPGNLPAPAEEKAPEEETPEGGEAP